MSNAEVGTAHGRAAAGIVAAVIVLGACVGDYRLAEQTVTLPEAAASGPEGRVGEKPEGAASAPPGELGSTNMGDATAPTPPSGGGQGGSSDEAPEAVNAGERSLDAGAADAANESSEAPAACGAEGESCCAGDVCGAGLGCSVNTCVRCASLRRVGPLSDVRAVSADGRYAVGAVGDGRNSIPYRWPLDGSSQGDPLGTLVGSLDGAGGYALAVSADGRFVVGVSPYLTQPNPDPPLRAFTWERGLRMNDLGDLPGVVAQSQPSAAWSISGDGRVVVGTMMDILQRQRAFRWNAQVLEELGDLANVPSSFQEARGTNADGSVVVGSVFGDAGEGQHAYRWDTESRQMEELVPLPGATQLLENVAAVAVSGDGRVIVGSAYADGTQRAMHWTRETGLGVLPSLTPDSASRAFATNADGTTVVGSADVGNGTAAVIWRTDAQQGPLSVAGLVPQANLEGWELESTLGVSANGRVLVGYGTYQGGYESWVAVLGPICPN